MIYLIDDKKTRQNDFGWTEERFAQYGKILTPLYTINDVVKIGEKLYDNENIILYHESFLDFTNDKEKAVMQRSKLSDKATSNDFLSVAFFSGSQSSRFLEKNIAHLPVAILYRNLEVFVQQFDQNNGNLKYLLFGEKPEIEQELDKNLTDANKYIENEPAIISGRNLFIRTNLRNIQNPIKGAEEVTIFPDVSDEKLSQKINEWLSKEEYDNIFIPLCFGQTLSDFNGLRLATHIRCSESPNQLTRIFIYGFVGIEYLLQNEYFNILKTKGVELVGYSKKVFQHAASCSPTSLKPQELPNEIKKLELQPPKNYLDNHSIANEWAIHQWAKTLGCDANDELTKVFQNVEENLYFKYLRTINPISELDRISPENLKIKCEEHSKVLLIDDEASKGWATFYSSFFNTSSNKIKFKDSGIDFKYLNTKEEFISQVESIILEFNPDVVLLDLRLLDSDFDKDTLPSELTGLKGLEKIKEINKGIQVIITTASNKAWNFNLAKQKGAYDFIIKDGFHSPGKSIDKLISAIEICAQRAAFLKEIDQKISLIKELILSNTHFNDNGDKDKLRKRMFSNLDLAFDLLDLSYQIPDRQKNLAYSYLQLFLLIEEFASADSVEQQTPILFSENDQIFINHSMKQICIVRNKKEKNYTKLAFDAKYKLVENVMCLKRRMDTNFFVSSILIYKYGNLNSSIKNWTSVYSVRNDVAHEGYTPNKIEVNKLLDFMVYFFDNSNESNTNIDKGLVPVTYEESLQALAAKFNRR